MSASDGTRVPASFAGATARAHERNGSRRPAQGEPLQPEGPRRDVALEATDQGGREDAGAQAFARLASWLAAEAARAGEGADSLLVVASLPVRGSDDVLTVARALTLLASSGSLDPCLAAEASVVASGICSYMGHREKNRNTTI